MRNQRDRVLNVSLKKQGLHIPEEIIFLTPEVSPKQHLSFTKQLQRVNAEVLRRKKDYFYRRMTYVSFAVIFVSTRYVIVGQQSQILKPS